MADRKRAVTLADRLEALKLTLRPPTQGQLARVLGVAQPQVSRWLSGAAPDLDRAPAIAAALGCSLSEVEQMILNARRGRRDLERRLVELEAEVHAQRELLEEMTTLLQELAAKSRVRR